MQTAAMSAAGPEHRTEPTYLHTSVSALAHRIKQDPGSVEARGDCGYWKPTTPVLSGLREQEPPSDWFTFH